MISHIALAQEGQRGRRTFRFGFGVVAVTSALCILPRFFGFRNSGQLRIYRTVSTNRPAEPGFWAGTDSRT